MAQRTERIKSLGARSRFRVGPLLVQPDRMLLTDADGVEKALEPRTMEVLVALAEHAGETLSAEQLLIEVWRGAFYGDNPVHKAIAQLRRAMGDDTRTPRYIETIRKRGYRLIAPVSFPDDYRRSAVQADAWASGSPFVGLSAFGAGHAGVFFGRSRATAELLSAMRAQLDNQRRFVLLVGASGCGKTSLLRAGAIPLLRQDGGFDGLHALALADCDLTHGGDVLIHMAAALAQWKLGDRPVFAPQPPQALAQTLRERPEAVREAVEEAFRRLPPHEIAERPHAHLLLTIDHAESLVASPRIDAAERTAFAQLLDAVCDTPRVLVAMIARSDFYPKLVAALPTIAERKHGDGHIDVLIPRAGEIAQIIRSPALLAGLSFEEDAQTLARLDDTLRDAALAQPDALPLLQHTLQALYERRSESGTLTYAAYREIGGLEGALAYRAEAVYTALPPAAQARFDALLSQLIVIQPDSDSVSARRLLWSSLGDDEARALVETLIRARLFVGELNDGRPGFGVAHEALLRQWPRARDWAQDNRRLLRARAQLQRAAVRWVDAGRRDDMLINAGQPLTEAAEAVRRLPDGVDSDSLDLLRASERLHRRRRRLKLGATVALAALAAISSVLAVLALRARDEAERRREEALRLTDFMLVDLAEKLRPLGNLKLLDSISGQALSSFADRDDTQLGAADLVNRSRALRTLGEVLMEQGRLDDARTAFEGADRAARAAVARAPRDGDARAKTLAETGIAAYWLGYYHYRRSNFEAAQRHWQAYLRSSIALVKLAPDNPEWLVEESYAHNNLGTLARDTGRPEEAIGYFRKSAALKQRALAMRPDDATLRYDLIDTLSWISTADEAQGRLEVAANGYAEQIGMLRGLIAENPGARAWQRRLATSLLRTALLAVARGELEQAQRMIGESVTLLERLTGEEPDNRVWQRDLAHALMESGEIARMRGDAATAARQLRRARAVSSRLVAAPNAQAHWRLLDAMIRAIAALNGAADARTLDAAVSDLERASADAAEDVNAATALARVLISRGLLHRAAGRETEARNDWRSAQRALARLPQAARNVRVVPMETEARSLLGERDAASIEQARWLAMIGYRHPDYSPMRRESTQGNQ